MRRYAISVAVAGFFVMATVAYLSEVPVLVCALRGLAGAAVLYVMTHVAGKVVLGIVVDAMVRDRTGREPSSERRNK